MQSAPSVPTIGAPPSVLARQQERQPATPGDAPDLFEQRAARAVVQSVVPEDDPAASRQAFQGAPQSFALPFVGHQPEARQRLAAVHGSSYSSAHG